MRPRKCPKPEAWMEWLSISEELSWKEKFPLWWHQKQCQGCRSQIETLSKKLDAQLSPEPDITSSLIRVYSRLKQDETLILKGWKLDSLSRRPKQKAASTAGAWIYRGSLLGGLASLAGFVVYTQLSQTAPPLTAAKPSLSGTNVSRVESKQALPYAQIRFEEKNRTHVQYVQPELIHRVDFKTTSGK